MAVRLPTPRYSIQHSRFTKQDGWQLWDLSLSLNGNIAVTRFNVNTDRTYIDVYTNVRHSDSRDKPKIIYSKEFEKYTAEDGSVCWGREVSFYPGSDTMILCGLGDKLEVIDLIQDRVIKSRKIKLVKHGDDLPGNIQCLSVRETEIFIGFSNKSNKITVYDVIDLNELKSIILQGIQDGYWPYDMTAVADRIFVNVGEYKEGSNNKSLIFEEKNGSILSELTKPTDTVQWYVFGLALNITLNVIAVAWSQTYEGTHKGKDVIVFYSLLSENNCSFLIVEVEIGVFRIRISDRGDRIVTGDRVTRECKVYDMSEFFSYGHMKENLQSQLQEDDCLKLTDYFALPDDQRDEIFKSDTPTENLLLALEGKGVIQPSNVDRLAAAFTELGIKSSCSYLVDFYQKTRHIRDKTILSAETTVSNDGGSLQIENTDIKLIIPPNALGTNNAPCLVRMRVIPPGNHVAVPSSFSSHSSTVLELLPNNLRFQQPVELTLPHCLKLKKGVEYKAKIFMSHHEGDVEPRWEEVTDHHYILRDKACTLWLNHFCWAKYEIDDEIVEAKRIQVYTAAKPICVPDDIAVVEVGYHLDLPGAGENLRLNPSLVVDQRRLFLFLREGNHPLRVSLQKIRPLSWKYSTPEENPKEIPFRSVASSIECSCPFLLEQETESCNIPTCIFKASQNQNHFQLLIRPKTIPTPTQPTGSHTTFEVHYQENITTGLGRDSKHLAKPLCIKEPTVSSLPMAHDSLGKEPAVYRTKDEKDDYVPIGNTVAYQALEPHLRSDQTHQRQQTVGIRQRQLLQYSGQQPDRNPLLIQKYQYSQHLNMMPISTGIFGGLYGPHEPPWYSESDAQGANVIKYNTLISIARKLDPPDVLHNDWRMLAGELGFTVEDIAMFERNKSPTCNVITCAILRRKLTSTEHLKSILKKMNRKDAAECLPDYWRMLAGYKYTPVDRANTKPNSNETQPPEPPFALDEDVTEEVEARLEDFSMEQRGVNDEDDDAAFVDIFYSGEVAHSEKNVFVSNRAQSTSGRYTQDGSRELLQHPLPGTEAVVTTDGVTLMIPDTMVELNIPPGALPKHVEECVIKMRLVPRKMFQDNAMTFTSHSSVVVEILPNNIILKHPAQLVIPHCLSLKENKAPTAKIYMSHHQEGCLPCWEEHPDLEYCVKQTHSIVWLKTFCWVTIKVDDKDVLAKHLILYSCGEKLMPEDKYAVTAVGYYPDLDGERKFLNLNQNMIVSERSPFVFLKEGSYPLCVLLVKHSTKWELWSPQSVMEIAFDDISSSFEHTCKFLFQKTDESAPSLMCLFQAYQERGQQAINLAICPEKLSSGQDIASGMCDSSTQTQEITLGAGLANTMTMPVFQCDEDLPPNRTKEEKGESLIEVEENLIQNIKLDESHQDLPNQGRPTSSYGTLDAAVRPKTYVNQQDEDCENEIEVPRPLAIRGDYGLFPSRGVGPPWLSQSFLKRYLYNPYLPIPPYGPVIGSPYAMCNEHSHGQGEARFQYSIINAISKKLDPMHPLGHDWRQLADKLGFSLDDITSLESEPSSTSAVIGCAIKNGRLNSPEQLKDILVQIERSDAAAIINTEKST